MFQAAVNRLSSPGVRTSLAAWLSAWAKTARARVPALPKSTDAVSMTSRMQGDGGVSADTTKQCLGSFDGAGPARTSILRTLSKRSERRCASRFRNVKGRCVRRSPETNKPPRCAGRPEKLPFRWGSAPCCLRPSSRWDCLGQRREPGRRARESWRCRLGSRR
jgi:hypothetical protein